MAGTSAVSAGRTQAAIQRTVATGLIGPAHSVAAWRRRHTAYVRAPAKHHARRTVTGAVLATAPTTARTSACAAVVRVVGQVDAGTAAVDGAFRALDATHALGTHLPAVARAGAAATMQKARACIHAASSAKFGALRTQAGAVVAGLTRHAGSTAGATACRVAREVYAACPAKCEARPTGQYAQASAADPILVANGVAITAVPGIGCALHAFTTALDFTPFAGALSVAANLGSGA
jgi:hypothetical protein